MGTLDYMAPEQAADARTADARADVYALGCTLYHLLTGRVPFPGGSAPDKLARLQSDEPEPLHDLRSDLPAGLAIVIGKMMAKRPEDRFQSATELADALAPFTVRSGQCHPPAGRGAGVGWSSASRCSRQGRSRPA